MYSKTVLRYNNQIFFIKNTRFYPILLLFFFSKVLSLNLDFNYPIIYEDPQIGDAGRATYFGYTLVTYSRWNQTWIQIGAPRGNDTSFPDIQEPGLIYRCKFGDHCEIFAYDKEGNIRDKTLGYNQRKDNSWLGGTMALHPTSDLLLVCAPRWINEVTGDWHIPGACYTHSARDNDYNGIYVYKVLPLLGNDIYSFEKRKVYNYAMGQAGMSAYFPENKGNDETVAILGAPGVMNWKGSTILLKDSKSLPDHSNKRDINGYGMMNAEVIPSISPLFKDADYNGYSVASGYFFSPTERLFVSSSPHAELYRGQVILYNFPKNNNEQIALVQKLLGDDGVGFFGASLAVADLNNDGYDDLLVSSPTLKVPTVFIFVGSRRRSLAAPNIGLEKLQGSPAIDGDSRFGLAISVSDLDGDGYKEILIGAPFADDGKGAVAIWKGGSNGPIGSGAPALILYASDFNNKLRGFGISIDSKTDIDGNGYPDVAIGSFVSGHAVILRSRPVVKLGVPLSLSALSNLTRSSTFINVTLCTSTNPINIEKLSSVMIRIKRIISIDKVFKRVYLSGKTSTNHVYTDKISKDIRENRCETLKLILNDKIKNYLDPIEITVNATIIDYTDGMNTIFISKNDIKGTDKFDKSYPISDAAFTRLGIPFETECGSDNICNADLIINITTKNDKFVIGSSNTLKLDINVENKGEHAYLTEIYIYLPQSTSLSYLPSNCRFEELAIICELDNPLKSDSSKTMSIEVDMHDVVVNKRNEKYLSFIATVITKSKLVLPLKNNFTLNLPLAIEASVLIAGKSSQNIFAYVKSEDNDTSEMVTFKNMYEVQKFGASPVDEVLITIKVPYAYKIKSKDVTFVKIFKPEGYQAGQPFSCKENGFSYEQDNSDYDYEGTVQDYTANEVVNSRGKRHINGFFIPLFNHNSYVDKIKREINKSRAKRSLVSVKNDQNKEFKLPLNRTVRISCDQVEVTCLSIQCLVGPFQRSQVISRLQLTMKVDFSVIQGAVMGAKDILVIKSEGSAIIPNSKPFVESGTSISSVFISTPKPTKVALWWIILSVILGLLLLTFIVIGLVKAGFFERKKKHELEVLKQCEDKEDMNPGEEWTEENLMDEDANFVIDERIGDKDDQY